LSLVGFQLAVHRTAIPDQANISVIFDTFGQNQEAKKSNPKGTNPIQQLKFGIGPELDLTSTTLKSWEAVLVLAMYLLACTCISLSFHSKIVP
jgi:hypothetical protein